MCRRTRCQSDLSRCDHQLARLSSHGELCAYVVARSIPYNRCSCDYGSVCSGILSCHACCHAVDRVTISIHVEVESLQSFGCLLLAIVHVLGICCPYRDLVLRISVSYRQSARYCAYYVVAGERSVIQRIGEAVLFRSRQDPSAGHAVNRAFAFCKTIACYRDSIVYEFFTVILLGRICGCHEDRPRFDHEGSRFRSYLKLICNIVTGCIEYLCLALHIDRICSGIYCRAFSSDVFYSILVSFDREVERFESAYALLSAVILRRQTLWPQYYTVLCISGCDCELSEYCCDVVVICFSSVIQAVAECILTYAHQCADTRDIICRALTVYEAVACHSHFIVLQSLAVVLACR